MLLHILVENAVKGEFVDFPYRTDHHGERKREYRYKKRRQLKDDIFVTVKDSDKKKAKQTGHDAAERMQEGIPVGNRIVKAAHLSQND